MLLETHVAETILCVTFGARLRSVPFSLLGLPSAARTAKVAQGLRNGHAWGPFEPPTSPKGALRTLPRQACGFILTSGWVSSL